MRLRKTLRCVKLLKNFSYLFIRFWAFFPKGNFLLCSLCFGLDYYLNVRINWPDNAAWNCVECCMQHWMGAWREWMNLESGDLPDCKAGKLWELREETTSRCLWVARFVFLAKLGTSEEVNKGFFLLSWSIIQFIVEGMKGWGCIGFIIIKVWSWYLQMLTNLWLARLNRKL